MVENNSTVKNPKKSVNWYSRFNENKEVLNRINLISRRFQTCWKTYVSHIREDTVLFSDTEIKTIFSNFVNSLAIKSYEKDNPMFTFEEFIVFYCISVNAKLDQLSPPLNSVIWLTDTHELISIYINSEKKLEGEINSFLSTNKLGDKIPEYYLTPDLNYRYIQRLDGFIVKHVFGNPKVSEDKKRVNEVRDKLIKVLDLFKDIFLLEISQDTSTCDTYDLFINTFCSDSQIFISEYDFNKIKEMFISKNVFDIFDDKSILFNKQVPASYINHVINELERILKDLTKQDMKQGEIESDGDSNKLPCFGNVPLESKVVSDNSEPIHIEQNNKRTSQIFELIGKIRQNLIGDNWGRMSLPDRNLYIHLITAGTNIVTIEDLDLIFSISISALEILKTRDEFEVLTRLKGYKRQVSLEQFPNFYIFSEDNLSLILSNLKLFEQKRVQNQNCLNRDTDAYIY